MAEQKNITQGQKNLLPAVYEASTGNLLPPEQRRQLITWAERRGLNAFLGHVCLYFGNPWVTIDGWYYLFRNSYPRGDLTTCPLNEGERKERQLEDNVHAWRADVFEVEGGHHLAVGYGYARAGEEPLAGKSAVEPRWPWRMAEKRAEEDALRKVVPLTFKENKEQ